MGDVGTLIDNFMFVFVVGIAIGLGNCVATDSMCKVMCGKQQAVMTCSKYNDEKIIATCLSSEGLKVVEF